MRERRNLATFLALGLFCAVLAAFAPFWPLGAALDDAGAAAAFRWRRPPKVSSRVTLVEIDDVSIEALGPWPWDTRTIRKLFEAPFYITEMTVSTLSPGDFRGDWEAGKAFYRGLTNLPGASAAYAYRTEAVPLDILSLLGETPGGGQSAILREPMMPKWRAMALRGIIRRSLLARPAATEDEMAARVLDPYWRDSLEVGNLARFWYAQAVSERSFGRRSAPAGFALENFDSFPEADELYLPPVGMLKGPVGLAGRAGGADFPAVPAAVMHRDRFVARLGFAVAGRMRGFSPMRFDGRRLVIPAERGGDRTFRLDPSGGFVPNWTGNGSTAWDAGFVNRLSAAALVELANARRATWEAYRRFESEMGLDRMAALVARYEQAVDVADPDVIIDAERDIVRNMSILRDMLEAESTARALGDERVEDFRKTIFELEEEYTGLEHGIVAYFTQAGGGFTDKIILIAGTARQFRTMRTPWGEAVSPAALEAALLNSIVTGRTVRDASALAKAALIAAGALVAAAAGRFGGLRALPPAVLITGGAVYGWFYLFDTQAVLAGFHLVAAAPAGYLTGAAAFHALVGRHRRRVKRILKGRIAKEQFSGAAGQIGSRVFRQVDSAAVIAVDMVSSGGEPPAPVKRRYVRQVSETLRENGAVLLDSAGEVEGAFGWLEGAGNASEMAIFSGLSARRRLRLLGEKLRAEGSGGFTLRMGLGCGGGEIAAATFGAAGLRSRGEAFERARIALAASRRLGAGLVICAADREATAETHELRRLDAPGEFWEVIEKKGAAAVAALEVRDLYEAALEAWDRGDREGAAGLVRRALEIRDDGPSQLLLRRLEAGEDL